MIMVANDITSPTEMMKKADEQTLYHSLVNPKPAIEAKIRQLRIVNQLNPKQYAAQKRTLPYFVCGIFNPPYRRTENFAYTENFIIDIDKLSDKLLDAQEVKKRLQRDERVRLCFISPSGDGLKVMFQLQERCYDPGLYSIFYKTFARDFSQQHDLSQVIDSRTSDVARACFISIDPDAYYNPQATPVNLRSYIDIANPDAILQQQKQNQHQDKEDKKIIAAQTPAIHDPDKEIINKIKQQLNPNGRQQKARDVIVPQELNTIIDALCQHINQTGLIVSDVVNIQYAKQIRVQMNLRRAEVNLFYGKRGYSVVQSTKTGTDPELNEVVAELIRDFIATL